MTTIAKAKESHLSRFRQIAEVLARHGLGSFVTGLGLQRFLPFHSTADFRYAPPEHLRRALEELGATFIKFGQLLSTRADLLPPEYQTELARLQDDAPPVSGEEIRERIEAELGCSLDTVFAEFDLKPLAAASIGQAHAATLFDGTEVVVKVRRPNVVEQVEEDLEIIHNLAAVASRHWEVARHYDLPGLAEEFATTLRAELDYIHEAQSAERFAENFADHQAVHIPRIFWETTTSRVLTLERIRGTKISDTAALDALGLDRPTLAVMGTQVILKMVFEDGFFHADLHPGNLFIEPEGTFGLIDFGMTGVLDEVTQEHLANLIYALASQDYERLQAEVLAFGATKKGLDREQLKRDLEHLVKPVFGKPLGEIALGSLLTEAFAIIRHHHLRLPPNLALLIKTIIQTESLGRQLDPDFHLTEVIVPYAQRLMMRRYSPTRLLRRAGRVGMEMIQLGEEMPQQVRRLLNRIDQGGFEVGMRPDSFQPLLDRLERVANRIVLGILASAFIVGLAALLAVYHPPGIERWAGVMFGVGFFFALVLGAYLALSILRSGHKRRDP